MSKPTPAVFTSAFVLPEERPATISSEIQWAGDGLRQLDDLMVVLEALGGPYTPKPAPATWKIIRL